MNALRAMPNDYTASVQTVDQTSSYLRKIFTTLQSFSSLENNWDSYGALAPTRTSLVASGHLATELLNDSTPLPDIFPMPNGNIQFEWSCFGIDLEIEIESMSKCYVSFENTETDEEWEKEFTYDLTELSKILSDLTISSIDHIPQPQPQRPMLQIYR